MTILLLFIIALFLVVFFPGFVQNIFGAAKLLLILGLLLLFMSCIM